MNEHAVSWINLLLSAGSRDSVPYSIALVPLYRPIEERGTINFVVTIKQVRVHTFLYLDHCQPFIAFQNLCGLITCNRQNELTRVASVEGFPSALMKSLGAD